MINIKTFAQVREITGEDSLALPLPDGCSTVSQLKSMLAARSANWQQVLADGVLCAVNQELGDDDSQIKDNDEVAFFPPVTGG
ncbi:molybdopterin converting factor subunit 1 [Alteromonas confluentis]|uniref:Molybdopterin synthase sulfur carrier subunit n=1 Tax=Alteromonas confluentis TaxID=1656094 RepID=A0A1E7ZBM8_9ALTE|nr:molybdopterin converting factor subunit 1 [Alteromonas confluentis]OFC70872.1 molybdopterin converting factor subunit 1 [Alteromonas confluentis]